MRELSLFLGNKGCRRFSNLTSPIVSKVPEQGRLLSVSSVLPLNQWWTVPGSMCPSKLSLSCDYLIVSESDTPKNTPESFRRDTGLPDHREGIHLEFPNYGYRRVQAEPPRRRILVNLKIRGILDHFLQLDLLNYINGSDLSISRCAKSTP
jgi:hypothetical protein